MLKHVNRHFKEKLEQNKGMVITYHHESKWLDAKCSESDQMPNLDTEDNELQIPLPQPEHLAQEQIGSGHDHLWIPHNTPSFLV